MFAPDALAVAAYAVLSALLNGLWQGLLLVGLVGGLLHYLPVAPSAASRYAVLLATLLALLGLPLLAGVASASQEEQGRPGSTASALSHVAPALASETEEAGETGAVPPAPAERTVGGPSEVAPRALPTAPSKGFLERHASDSIDQIRGLVTDVRLTRWRVAPLTLAGKWVYFLLGAWLLVALMRLARVGRSVLALERLKRESRPLPLRYECRLAQRRTLHGTARSVRVAASDRLPVPVAAGLVRPMVLVPAALLERLTEEELAQVVLHERAHLQRWDDWTHLLQKLTQAVLFFHPGVYWIGRQMELAREVACDERVVSLTRKPKAYAALLARLVELDAWPGRLSVAPGLTSGKAHLFARVETLLDHRPPKTPRRAQRVFAAAAGVLGALFFTAAATSPVIVFSPSRADSAAPVAWDAPAATPPEPAPAPASTPTGVAGGVKREETTYQGGAASDVRASAPPAAKQNPSSGVATPHALEPLKHPASPVRSEAPQDSTRQGLSRTSLIKTLRAAAHIPSSGDKARFLTEATKQLTGDEDVIEAYLSTAETIAGSVDRARTLIALVERQRLSKRTAIALLRAASGISSSGDKTQVLLASVGGLPDDEAVRAAYVDAAETVASGEDRSRALKALIQARRN